jgi:hypothetical protein
MSELWPQYYILVDRVPFAVDVMTWAQACQRRYDDTVAGKGDAWGVANTEIGNVRVSTVFLGLDHNMRSSGDPVLFETMIFGGPLDSEQWRYATYAQAERGHAEAVTKARIASAQIKSISDKAHS